tara:strand:+ start:147 stop:278 length:132 start_codon:yes stop_codon:yes gene_type:complete
MEDNFQYIDNKMQTLQQQYLQKSYIQKAKDFFLISFILKLNKK